MLTRRWLLLGMAIASGSLVANRCPGQAPEPPTGVATLEDTLNYGLRPRTPDEKAFLTMVVAKVEAKELPLELVISTYRWATRKRPYPQPYFERALRVRALQIGVTL